ncbi:uncharacterized protein LOC134184229 isoform X2 [Corticium candelabrum]|uniref:uncharacterized protein LOC134184229 isoform X2 n=1 Tax=Corticium candelabrum TaxID=121492 RepID=UPI002E32BBB8|nr:uncharacterized protein LOC134184229 isoform X2 [Corticium candelabrum]
MSSADRPLRDLLKLHYEFLTKELDVRCHIAALFQRNVISRNEKETLTSKQVIHEQATYLIDALLRRDEEKIATFLEIMKTNEEQPHIYKKLFPRHESTEEETQGQDQVRHQNVEALTSSLAEKESQWEKLTRSHPDVLSALRPSLFLDRIRAAGILNQQEHQELQNKSLTERDRSHRLVNILHEKGSKSFETFCDVVSFVEGQSLIISEMKLQIVPLSSGHASEVTSCDEQTDQSCESPKNKKFIEHSSMPGDLYNKKTIPTATFIFRETDQNIVKLWEKTIRKLCQECFEIEDDDVVFLNSLPPDGQSFPKTATFMGDSDYKVAVLQLNGVSPHLVQKHRDRLVSLIAGFLKVKKDLIHFLEVIEGSSLVLLQIRLDAYLSLFAALGMKTQCRALFSKLKEAFPGLLMAKFRLGGLPSIQLINTGRSSIQIVSNKDFTGRCDVDIRIFVTHQMTFCLDHLSHSAEEIHKKLEVGCFLDVDDIDYSLEAIKEQLTAEFSSQSPSKAKSSEKIDFDILEQNVDLRHRQLGDDINKMGLLSQHVERTLSMMRERTLKKENLISSWGNFEDLQHRLKRVSDLFTVSTDHEEIVSRQSDIASSKKAGRNTRRFKKVKRKFVIDSTPFGNSAVVILTAQTPVEVHSGNECSYFYRITGLLTQSRRAPSLHLSHTLKAASEVLTKIRREADETSTQCVQMDIWVHVGRQLITNVHKSEALRSYNIGQVIWKMKHSEHGTNWTSVFESGFQEQDWFPFCRFLEENAALIHSTTRHDMKFTTPSHRVRRFKVWIPEYQTGGTDDVDPSQQEYLEGGRKVGCGVLLFPDTKRLIAEVSMPYYPLDCRLLIQTGIIDVTDQTEEEKKEDAILSQYYLDKFRVDGKSLQVPSRWLLPPKYRLIYHRRCERDYYRYQGFELTVSREKKMHPESPENIDVHIRSSKCEDLRRQNRGLDWKPGEIVSSIPEMLECAKSILSKGGLMTV